MRKSSLIASITWKDRPAPEAIFSYSIPNSPMEQPPTFDYTVSTSKDFPSTVAAVQEAIAAAGMRVLHIHDVQATLAEKGFAREPLKIVEFCSAKFANEFLNIDVKIGLCLPCKINVYTKDGQTFISGMRPIILSMFFPNADLGSKPEEVDTIIRSIIDRAK